MAAMPMIHLTHLSIKDTKSPEIADLENIQLLFRGSRRNLFLPSLKQTG